MAKATLQPAAVPAGLRTACTAAGHACSRQAATASKPSTYSICYPASRCQTPKATSARLSQPPALICLDLGANRAIRGPFSKTKSTKSSLSAHQRQGRPPDQRGPRGGPVEPGSAPGVAAATRLAAMPKVQPPELRKFMDKKLSSECARQPAHAPRRAPGSAAHCAVASSRSGPCTLPDTGADAHPCQAAACCGVCAHCTTGTPTAQVCRRNRAHPRPFRRRRTCKPLLALHQSAKKRTAAPAAEGPPCTWPRLVGAQVTSAVQRAVAPRQSAAARRPAHSLQPAPRPHAHASWLPGMLTPSLRKVRV